MRELSFLLFAIPAVIVVGCVVVTGKPTDSAPPATTATGTAAPTATPVPTAPATATATASAAEPAKPPARIRSTGKTGAPPTPTAADAGVADAATD